jgi:hypothetical protein
MGDGSAAESHENPTTKNSKKEPEIQVGESEGAGHRDFYMYIAGKAGGKEDARAAG